MSMYAEDSRFDSFHEMMGGVIKPIIGMVHLLPLPGSPVYDGAGLEPVIERALADARALQDGGVDAIEVENFSDISYSFDAAHPELVAGLTVAADHIRRAISLPLGICLLADPKASLAIAHAVGAQFIRSTVFTEASVDVSGLVLPRPHELLRYRKFLDTSIKIFADVHIKHSAPLARRSLAESVYDTKYFLADAILISGKHTGQEANIDDVRVAKEAAGRFPILLGSGFNERNAKELFKYADGAIVGTSLKQDGVSSNPVDVQRVRALMDVVKSIRSS